MNLKTALFHPGIAAALGAALLFGAGAPLAKQLLHSVSPWLLAALLYLGADIGLTLYRTLRRAEKVTLAADEKRWFAAAVLSGGVIGPVLLMFGLASMPASSASLLLNAETVFTTLLAWFVFREHFDRRLLLGMIAIVCGLAILSWPADAQLAGLWPAAAVLGACLAWAIDNNLTRKISLSDATWIASIKGLVAGSINLLLALALGARWPALWSQASALLVGFFAYGLSLVLFVIALRHLGTARTGAYFSLAPFIGAILALLTGESISIQLLLAGTLMALGLWLHLSEVHIHEHSHTTQVHEHEHSHDAHHQHSHAETVPPGTRHSHQHRHDPLTHSHAHYPDAHHQHKH